MENEETNKMIEDYNKLRGATIGFITISLAFDLEDEIVDNFQRMLLEFDNASDIYMHISEALMYLRVWKELLKSYYNHNKQKKSDFTKYNAMTNIFIDKLKSKLKVDIADETN